MKLFIVKYFISRNAILFGETRSTFENLMKSEVPMFDESANIESLFDIREELAEVKEKIKK